MFEKVLVPLDGSKLAECALPYLRNLAEGGKIGEVILLNVVEIPVTWIEGIDFIAVKKANVERSTKYLSELKNQLEAEGMKVNAEVMEGGATEAIVDYAKEKGVDLIVIGTHGYTGMKRLMFGSVALRVLHDAHCPVLLIRPESCR
ncbi:MAG TPA: universal stress protein [Syntrophales bacterium]|jgi:nucleotide-binding universal stress UspA family protein|nr:universal stress protein [Syntrophales bacterium]HPX55607.1 universal stress protein [Syntrophales bacterium]HQA82154.1 universal stress protein [Syntrophales bacterium]